MAAQQPRNPEVQAPLFRAGTPTDVRLHYSPKELQEALSQEGILLSSGLLQTEEGKLILPLRAQRKVLKIRHQTFHLGFENTY